MPVINSGNKISRMVVLGDSLSDRGTFDRRQILGFIPLSELMGLKYKSPRGRFTNGFLWADYFCTTVVEQFEFDDARKRLKLAHNSCDNADLSDAFLSHDFKLDSINEHVFSLNNDAHILYNGERFARFYCEAGLTSYTYTKEFIFNLAKEGQRLILATLQEKRELLLNEDKHYKISPTEKSETLVIEWSGANDLLTVNVRPTYEEVDKAVKARIENLEILIQQGYRNFVLFNLPDLALTPRYQAQNSTEQQNASQCSAYFNAQLAAQVKQISDKYQSLNFPIQLSIFDIGALFNEIYNNPQKYTFESDKLKTSYIDSDEFKSNKKNKTDTDEHISPSSGYMFWDDIHPTMDTHTWLALFFRDQYDNIFRFYPPDFNKRGIKESEDLKRHHLGIVANLPRDIARVLTIMHCHAVTMERSFNPNRRAKGELLKQFIFDLKCQGGNLHEICLKIKAFLKDQDNMAVVKTHYNPVFDLFTCKHTTRSEDYLAVLDTILDEYIETQELTERTMECS